MASAVHPDEPNKKRSKPSDDPNSFESLKKAYEETTPWRGNVDAKLNSASPYHFFLTRIKDIPDTYDEDLSITFLELLDKSLGELEHSVHLNYMVEVGWLLAQYAVAGVPNSPMTILYGQDDPDMATLPAHIKIKAVKVHNPDPYGHHHTKMSLFFYKDGSSRIVISTANLIESDWTNRTQGVWISPRLAPLPVASAESAGESVTGFKKDLLQYLSAYNLPDLSAWINILKKTDFSSIMVCFVASVPGKHEDNRFGYRKVKDLLDEHVPSLPADTWTLVAQCSSIGSLGPTPKSWLCGPFGKSLEGTGSGGSKEAFVKVIYPTLENVRRSVDGMLGGACLPYSSPTHHRQLWLKDQLWQWKSEGRKRTRAVPHIKTYTRLSPNGRRAAWFLLTSANLSKAAWGQPTAEGLHIRSHEVGVLFLPKFLTGEKDFRVKNHGSFDNNEDFPLPYDSNLTPYSSNDRVFLYDRCFS